MGGTPETLMGIPETLRNPVDVTVFVVEDVDGAERAEIGGGSVVARGLTMGNTPGVGVAAAELMPRLAISMEPIAIPVRGLPPGVVGAVDVGVEGVEAMPLEPAPHIPDTPTLPNVDDVDMPKIGSIPGSAVVADDADIPVPVVAPPVVVDAADPIVNPPPS